MKPRIPSVLLSNFITNLGGIFTNRREYLRTEMAKMQPALAKQRQLAAQENWSPETLEEEQAKLLRPLFLGISRDLIELSGLTAKSLYCPEALQEEVWKAITETLVPDLISKCYTDLTPWEINLEKDKKQLASIIPNGPGAVKAMTHFALKVVQSKLAVEGIQSSEELFDALIQFFKDAKSVEGDKIVKLLSAEATKRAFMEMLDKNVSDAARAPEMQEVLGAIETFIEPIIDKVLLAVAENLSAVEDNYPECLKEITTKCILAVTEHFEKLRATALSHNVANAHELSYAQLMQGMTLDGSTREYIFKEAKVLEAKAKLETAQKKLGQWRILSLSKQEKDSLGNQLSTAEKELNTAIEEIDAFVKSHWSDEGKAIKDYLQKERELTTVRKRVALAKRSFARWLPWSTELQRATAKCRGIEGELFEARNALKMSRIQEKEDPLKSPAEAENRIFDLFSDEAYIKQLESLENGDLSDEEEAEVKKAIAINSIDTFFKPLANEIFSLVNVEQFDEIPFLGLLGDKLKKDCIEKAKEKMPEILYQVFETLGEPTMFLNIFNSILEKQAASGGLPAQQIENAKDLTDANDDFDKIGGQIVMAAIELMPSRVEEAIFMLTRVKGMTKELAGKAVGAELRKFLKSESIIGLINQALKSGVESILPNARWSSDEWDEEGEIILGKEEKMPQTLEDFQKVEAKKMDEKQLYEKVKNGIASVTSEIIKNTIQEKINAACDSVNNLTFKVIRSILSEDKAVKVASALKVFTSFIYKICAAVIEFIVSPLWLLTRVLILKPKSEQLASTIRCKAHKRLIHQLPMIVLEILKRERLKIAKMKAEKEAEELALEKAGEAIIVG